MRENHRKMGDIYKTSSISAAINYKFPNSESHNNFVLLYYLVSKLSNFLKGSHVNETTRNETCRKIKGGTYKISNISAANCHRVQNLEPNLC